jgi:hypothetical protein
MRVIAAGALDDDEKPDEGLAAEFEFGLDRVLDGVAALMTRRETAS